MSHPFAQSFIANESEIIERVNNSNLEKQITNAIADSLNITSFIGDICMSILNQFIEQSPNRFSMSWKIMNIMFHFVVVII